MRIRVEEWINTSAKWPRSSEKRRLPPEPGHPSGDKRFKILETHMKRHQHKSDALIEVLHKAGVVRLPGQRVALLSRKASPPSRYGVATFYHFFTLEGRSYLCRLHGHRLLRER